LAGMKRGVTISALGHGAVLLWALVSFARPFEVKSAESMPIDIVSADEFSQMMAGAKKAPKAPEPKPVVEKLAEAKPVEDLTAKVDKTEVKAAVETPPTPEPTPKQPDPKPAAAPPQPKTEAKAPDKKEPEQKIDPIATALKKDDAKKPEKKAAATPQPLPPKPTPQPPKFDPRQVAALLDKRDAKRVAATGSALNANATLGALSGNSASLSQSEIDALRRRLMDLWSPPAGVQNPEELVVRIRVRLAPDGRIVGNPQVLSGGSSALFQASRESAIRAIYRGQPFDMLRPEHYELWKEIDLTFDPRDLARG